MQEGQTTGQRVEVRNRRPNSEPDIVKRGQVVAWDIRGNSALVQADRGNFFICDLKNLSVIDSQEQRDRKTAADARLAGADHNPQSCGPLCREHGDARDTNYTPAPVAVG